MKLATFKVSYLKKRKWRKLVLMNTFGVYSICTIIRKPTQTSIYQPCPRQVFYHPSFLWVPWVVLARLWIPVCTVLSSKLSDLRFLHHHYCYSLFCQKKIMFKVHNSESSARDDKSLYLSCLPFLSTDNSLANIFEKLFLPVVTF